jgi:glycosyltransferase involved in cell wall biosynthesis
MPSLLYVYHSAFDPTNAHGNQIVHTCNALAECGYDVTLLAAGDPLGFLETNELDASFGVVTVPLDGKNNTFDRLGYYLAAAIRSRWYDCLFTRDISFLRVLRRFPSWWYPPTLYEAHKAYSGINQIAAADERQRLKAADRVVTISQAIADDLAALDIYVATVVSDAATTRLLPTEKTEDLRANLGIAQDRTVFIYLGSISTWKNDLELVIEGYAQVEIEDSELLIVGAGGSEVDPLRKRAQELEVADRVGFINRVPQREAFLYLAAADVGIVPLKDGNRIASHYTSPLKLYEYRLCGLEVVASNVPAVVNALGEDDHVHCYETGSVEDFKRASEAAAVASRNGKSERGGYRYTYERRGDQLDAVLKGML